MSTCRRLSAACSPVRATRNEPRDEPISIPSNIFGLVPAGGEATPRRGADQAIHLAGKDAFEHSLAGSDKYGVLVVKRTREAVRSVRRRSTSWREVLCVRALPPLPKKRVCRRQRRIAPRRTLRKGSNASPARRRMPAVLLALSTNAAGLRRVSRTMKS